MEIEKLEFGESKKENVSKESTEKINNAEQESLTLLNTKSKEPVGGRFEKRKSALGKEWYILAGVVILLGLLMTYFIQNRIFYNNIPVIVNANDFVNAQTEDILDFMDNPIRKMKEGKMYFIYII